MGEQKPEEKTFAVKVDSELRSEVKLAAYKDGLLVKEMTERLFRLVVKADGVKNLERIYRESQK